jgi:hypothetical protein
VRNELDFWREEPSKKAKAIANEIELLARRERATGLQVSAYVLELAANEARKDAQMVRDDRGGALFVAPASKKIRARGNGGPGAA